MRCVGRCKPKSETQTFQKYNLNLKHKNRLLNLAKVISEKAFNPNSAVSGKPQEAKNESKPESHNRSGNMANPKYTLAETFKLWPVARREPKL